jgi:hypothetical protein
MLLKVGFKHNDAALILEQIQQLQCGVIDSFHLGSKGNVKVINGKI